MMYNFRVITASFASPCPYSMSVSVLHVHVQCCPCCMPMSMLHEMFYELISRTCCMNMLHEHVEWTCCMITNMKKKMNEHKIKTNIIKQKYIWVWTWADGHRHGHRHGDGQCHGQGQEHGPWPWTVTRPWKRTTGMEIHVRHNATLQNFV